MTRGRPKLTKGESKAQVLTLRLTPKELRQLERDAKRGRLTVSEYVRKRLEEPPAATLKELTEHCKRLAARTREAEHAASLGPSVPAQDTKPPASRF